MCEHCKQRLPVTFRIWAHYRATHVWPLCAACDAKLAGNNATVAVSRAEVVHNWEHNPDYKINQGKGNYLTNPKFR